MENPFLPVGLLSDADRSRANKIGWLNAGANLLQASGPKIGGLTPTPFQLLGTGLQSYATGSQNAAYQMADDARMAQEQKAREQSAQWAKSMAGQLGDYGITPEAASGMSPETIAKLIVDAEEQNRKAAQETKLNEMITARQMEMQDRHMQQQTALQRMIADRQAAAQNALFDRQEASDTRKAAEAERLLSMRLGAKLDANGNQIDKPMPASIVKLQDDNIEALASSTGVQKNIDDFTRKIEEGKMPLGPVNNMKYKAQNAMGSSTEASRNFASFNAMLESMRNASLRLNAGVQTDGDAQRAWNELINNIGDEKVVVQRLREIKKYNQIAAGIRKARIDRIRSEYNKDAIDYKSFEDVGSAFGGDTQTEPSRQVTDPETGITFKGFK